MKTMTKTVAAFGLVAILAAGCNTTPTQDGAVLGGALGAGLGAIVGNQSGHQGEGALIGAGAGALTGAIVGDSMERQGRVGNRQPAAAQSTQGQPVRGHYETRLVTGPNGEVYEERVFVRDR